MARRKRGEREIYRWAGTVRETWARRGGTMHLYITISGWLAMRLMAGRAELGADGVGPRQMVTTSRRREEEGRGEGG